MGFDEGAIAEDKAFKMKRAHDNEEEEKIKKMQTKRDLFVGDDDVESNSVRSFTHKDQSSVIPITPSRQFLKADMLNIPLDRSPKNDSPANMNLLGTPNK